MHNYGLNSEGGKWKTQRSEVALHTLITIPRTIDGYFSATFHFVSQSPDSHLNLTKKIPHQLLGEFAKYHDSYQRYNIN